MLKVVGILFVMMCPFIAGLAPVALVHSYFNLTQDQFYPLFSAYSLAWVLLYCLWFDGSRCQRSL